MVISLLILLLRTFGLFWILGGIFAIREAMMVRFLDRAIAQITLKKENSIFLCQKRTPVKFNG